MRVLMPALVLGIFITSAAQAVLGESEDSVSADRTATKALKRSQIQKSKYTVHELTTDAGHVREYVSASGVVFAVAWDGMSHPDLSVLLGRYFKDYNSAAISHRVPGRKPQHIETQDAIVESSGHMRDLHGRAYLKSQVPTGVSVHEIN